MIANFTINTYNVTPSAGTGGTISPNNAQVVNYGSTKAFTLTASTGYSIGTTTGTCPAGTLSGSTYTTGAITANCTVIANFTINTYNVTPSVGTGSGTISPSNVQVVNYDSNKAFTLTPSTGYSIGTTTGTCGGTLSGSTYTTGAITANCTVIANFTQMTGTLTPATISCTILSGASTCTVNLNWSITNPIGTPTAITATGMTNVNVTTTLTSPQSGTATGLVVPYPGRTFYLYNDAIQLDSSVATATCAANTTWNGTICSPNQEALTVTPAGTGTGTVTSSPAGISCGADCSQSYNYNTAVVLTATPTTGSTFTGWTGACTGTGTCSLTMTAAKAVTATFSQLVMTGTLTPPTSSCIILSGASTCTVNLNWSITNPIGTPTAIAAVGMTNVNVTNTISPSFQSGTANGLVVPYLGRTFYLYNDALSLATSSATATCTSGTSWNGSICSSSPNGMSECPAPSLHPSPPVSFYPEQVLVR